MFFLQDGKNYQHRTICLVSTQSVAQAADWRICSAYRDELADLEVDREIVSCWDLFLLIEEKSRLKIINFQNLDFVFLSFFERHGYLLPGCHILLGATRTKIWLPLSPTFVSEPIPSPDNISSKYNQRYSQYNDYQRAQSVIAHSLGGTRF
jgi:hypothetical protein